MPLTSSQQDSFSLNGSAAEALQHQETGPAIAAVRGSTAVLTDPRQQQANLEQGQGQRGAASPAPSWPVDLEWDSQDSSQLPGNSIAIKRPAVREKATKTSNGKHPKAQPAEPSSNLDSRLDFHNGDGQTLLRAYNSRVAAGRLHAALGVLETLVAAGRIDVLKRCDHHESQVSCHVS